MSHVRNPYRVDPMAYSQDPMDAWDEGFNAALDAVRHQAMIHAGLTRSVLSASAVVEAVKKEAGNEAGSE